MTTPIDGALSPTSDGSALRRAYSCFPTGVVAVCHQAGDQSIGLAASSFATVSLDPPLVSLCVQNESATWPKLRIAPVLGVSVFAHDQDAECKQLAGAADRRFTGLDLETTADGALFIGGAVAQLSCTIYNEIPAGDHSLVLLKVNALRADPAQEPLVFHASTFRALERKKATTPQ
jgi:flavin reductase (DIM6/NTAB) family NADH-FMN oxidoreductase RutF